MNWPKVNHNQGRLGLVLFYLNSRTSSHQTKQQIYYKLTIYIYVWVFITVSLSRVFLRSQFDSTVGVSFTCIGCVTLPTDGFWNQRCPSRAAQPPRLPRVAAARYITSPSRRRGKNYGCSAPGEAMSFRWGSGIPGYPGWDENQGAGGPWSPTGIFSRFFNQSEWMTGWLRVSWVLESQVMVELGDGSEFWSPNMRPDCYPQAIKQSSLERSCSNWQPHRNCDHPLHRKKLHEMVVSIPQQS
jgi:hypothetical protein